MKEMKWIPCSDRLPDEVGRYLVQHEDGIIAIIFYEYGWNCSRNYVTGEIHREYEMKDIVAWMPLPEPYKDVENEESDDII